MSDFFVHRAMQIACMTDSQISSVHGREKVLGYCIPNWNVQECFGLSDIKTYHSISDEPGSMAAHAARIKSEILLQKIADVEEGRKPWDSVTVTNIENVHKFDWNVYNAKEAGQINFLYQGAKKSGGLRSRVMNARSFDPGGE